MEKVKLFYNPKSGKEEASKALDQVIALHEAAGLELSPLRLQKGISIKDMTQDLADYKYAIIMGGDGTLNSVIDHLLNVDIDIPIGIIPAGTANDFAKHLSITDNVEEATKNIINSKPVFMDIGKLNHRYFVNLASTGFFANPFDITEDKKKSKLGKLAYIFNGISQLKNLQCFDFKLHSSEYSYEGSLLGVIILNGKSIANVELAPKASSGDGLLDVLVFKESFLDYKFQNAFNLILEGNFDNLEGIDHFKSSKIYLECNDQPLTDLDGERGPKLPGTISCIKKRLKLMGINYII